MIADEFKSCAELTDMPPVDITLEDVRKLHDTQNWKAPVADGIKNFWWKYLKCTYKVIEQFVHQNVQAPIY
jgi:hypothetical protein